MIKSIVILIHILFGFSAIAQWQYPPTKIVDSTDTYFGVTYNDPYRWLENIKSMETEAWFKQQADFSNNILNNISGRDTLIQEWTVLDKLQPPKYNYRSFENGRLFYKKTMPGEIVGKAYYRDGINGKEQLIFDPFTYIAGKTLSITEILPSHDGKKVLISYQERGTEVSSIIIYDVDKRKFLPECIYPSSSGPISWTLDNKSFTYTFLSSDDNKSPEFKLYRKTKLHTLGNNVKEDLDFFSEASYPLLGIRPEDLPWATLEKDSRNYIFGYLSNVRKEFHCFYASISQFTEKKIDWKVLCTPADKLVRNMLFIGDTVFAITYRDAPNYMMVATDLKNPDWKHAEIIASEKNETLEDIAYSKNYIYITYSDGINNTLYKYNIATKKTSLIKLPFTGSAYIFCIDTKTNNCIVGITSWNHPQTEFIYNADTEVFSESIFNKPLNYPKEYTGLEVEETEVSGHDGTMIPLSIIYKKGIKLNGSNCCLMNGYGAYGNSLEPYFDVKLNSLVARGVVIAFAHVRGGGEKGQTWYKAGYKTTKPNTWKDFNSCAEYLVAKGYTSAAKLAGMGTSAGGILISRAITERPDLYGAAICNVGGANAMRMEFTPNGPANIPEFGTVKDSIESKALYNMDGLQHVVNGVKYPAVICVGGWNDPRIIAWQPGKFAAALQHASTSGKPILMKVNYNNGHFTEDKMVTYSNFADMYSFVLWQLGHPDFKLKPKASMFKD